MHMTIVCHYWPTTANNGRIVQMFIKAPNLVHMFTTGILIQKSTLATQKKFNMPDIFSRWLPAAPWIYTFGVIYGADFHYQLHWLVWHQGGENDCLGYRLVIETLIDQDDVVLVTRSRKFFGNNLWLFGTVIRLQSRKKSDEFSQLLSEVVASAYTFANMALSIGFD